MKFDDTAIEEYKFNQNKSPILINDVDINKIVVSNELSLHKQDFKCFIRYRDSKKMRPLCIFRPKMSIYKRDFDKTRCMYYSIKDEILLEKYNEI